MKNKKAKKRTRLVYEEALLSRHNIADIIHLHADSLPKRFELDDLEVTEIAELTIVKATFDERKITQKMLHSTGLKTKIAAGSYLAYKKIFEFRDSLEDVNLVRIWNYVPEITDKAKEMLDVSGNEGERYRQFNAGRMKAWNESGPKKDSRNIYPAATGIGIHNPKLAIEALLSPHQVVYVENPAQTPAFKYPRNYGSSRPAFSRATVHLSTHAIHVFVSGTGSIVGSKTVHGGNPKLQAKQIIKNISELIESIDLKGFGRPAIKKSIHISLDDLAHLRVYIRSLDILEEVKAVIDEHFPMPARVTYEVSDFCRKNLDLEMEAVIAKAYDK